jgi:hypothetical protein
LKSQTGGANTTMSLSVLKNAAASVLNIASALTTTQPLGSSVAMTDLLANASASDVLTLGCNTNSATFLGTFSLGWIKLYPRRLG